MALLELTCEFSGIAFWVFVVGHTLLAVSLGMLAERVSQRLRGRG